MEEKKVNIVFTATEIRDMLVKKLNAGSYNEPIADIIIGNLSSTDIGLGQLLKGLLGVFPKFQHEAGDFVYVKIDRLPSWKIDQDKTKEIAGVKDECILAEIKLVNPYSSSPYHIVFDAIDKHGKLAVIDYMIPDNWAEFVPDNLIEVLETIEKFKEEWAEKKEDLPF